MSILIYSKGTLVMSKTFERPDIGINIEMGMHRVDPEITTGREGATNIST